MTAWIVMLIWAIMFVWLGSISPLLGCLQSPTANSDGYARGLSLRQFSARIMAALLATMASAPIVFFLGVRRNVGTDYSTYVDMFYRFGNNESMHWVEPLYALLNRAAVELGSSGIVLVFMVSAFLSVIPLFYRVIRSSPIPWLSILILFGLSLPFFMANGVRSAIAIGIVMMIIPAIWHRQLFAWSLGILFAAGFHFSAFIMWPMFWILNLAWPRILVVVVFVIAIVISMIRDIGELFLMLLPILVPSEYSHYPEKIFERLEDYKFGFGYFLYISLGGILLYFWNRVLDQEREIQVFRNAAILGIVILIGSYQFWAIGRLMLYFIPALAIFLPLIVNRYVAPSQKIFWIMGFATIFSAMFIRGLLIGSHQTVPYNWIF